MQWENAMESYLEFLCQQERADATVQKYRHDIKLFMHWCDERTLSALTRESVMAWRKHQEELYAPATVNAAVAAVNGFLGHIGKGECCVKLLRVQHTPYRERRLELTRHEYFRLVKAAEKASPQTAHVLEAICATGIRVSELRFITVESVRLGYARIRSKGKSRTVFLPDRLRERLRDYCRGCRICQGSIFVNRKGKPLSRFTIWRRMKQLCQAAGVLPEKVFPHNLRHLFAVCFYHAQHDLEHLADILGHSSINTTRIYTRISGEEHRRQLNALKLTR